MNDKWTARYDMPNSCWEISHEGKVYHFGERGKELVEFAGMALNRLEQLEEKLAQK